VHDTQNDAAYRDGGIDNLNVSFLDQDFSCFEAELLDFFLGYWFATLELSDLATWGQRSEGGRRKVGKRTGQDRWAWRSATTSAIRGNGRANGCLLGQVRVVLDY